MALHFPSAKVKKKGEQILYFCQSCPRIHDNLALRLAIWMSFKLTLPLQVLCFLPKHIVNARDEKKQNVKHGVYRHFVGKHFQILLFRCKHIKFHWSG